MGNDDSTKIEVAVARLETLIKTHLEQQSIINTRLAAQNERHARFIYGSDDAGNPGARVRMDRLEQSEKRRTAISFSALTGVILLVMKQLWTVLTSGGNPPPH